MDNWTVALSPREQEIARLVAIGRKAHEIGAVLGITEQTVKNHKANIYNKLGVRNAVEMTRALEKRAP